MRGERLPGTEGGARRLDGCVDIGFCALGNGCERLSRGRIISVEILTRGGLLPGAGNKMSEAASVAIEPEQRLAGVFQRRAVLHAEIFFDDAHGFVLGLFAGRNNAAPRSGNGMPIISRITPGRIVFKLALDIAQHGTGAKAEEAGIEPRPA